MPYKSVVKSPDEIHTGKPLWQVIVTIAHDGVVNIERPLKIIPNNKPRYVENPHKDWCIGFTHHSGKLAIAPLQFFNVRFPKIAEVIQFNHNRLFFDGDEALLYFQDMLRYKPTLDELTYIQSHHIFKRVPETVRDS